eukprot:CAMPEP_0197474388 /NCGR_PEP_ID=MMETSP1309-20131121/5879_1 /TAXON_ID=464262 /ORGANISM="Genus nov. species nov., Strain RCC998" /LENGTH=537 /DNA_ID=CAMNT_0043014027 /DNA_START=147 /DNA_END=1760 /DNA_ORIENTATION=-
MRFSAAEEDLDAATQNVLDFEKLHKRQPFVFTIGSEENEERRSKSQLASSSSATSLRERDSNKGTGGGGGMIDKRTFEKELEYDDHVRQMSAAAWVDSNTRREKLNRELKEVYLEENQDLKSSIFSVLEQKATYQQEIKNFVGEKRKSPLSPLSPVHALGSSLQAVKEEIHKAKHQKLMEEAKQEAARQVEEQRRKLELETQRAQAAALKEQQKQAAEQQKQAAAMKQLEKAKADAAAKVKSEAAALKKKKEEEEAAKEAVPSGVRMSPSAAKWENSCAKVYDQHRGYASEIFKASKLERLKLEKPIKKAVNQLSCSKQQIRFVGQQMIQHLSQQHTQGKHFYSYCLVRLGDLIAQQGPGLGASKQLAFAYAEVSCMVASAFKDFIYVLISSLQKACPLVVPKFPKGYRGLPNEIKGHVSLYAALCQLSPQQWFPFTEHAWSYLARFLNALPANEQTAIALDSFLQIAGHALFVAFRRQQVKVFRYVTDEFVAALKEGDDIDAVKSRLETYVKSELFRQEPEGSYIPETDDSQHIRC